VASVRAQFIKDWMCYIVDDGSDPPVANEWPDDPRIVILRRQTRGGPSDARNMALASSFGTYVAFLDSDDVWYPDHLGTHLSIHNSKNPDMTYSDPDFAWRYWNETAGRFEHRQGDHPTIQYWGPFDMGKLIERNYIQTSSVVIWGALARHLRFKEDKDVEEDWEFFRAVAANDTVEHIPAITCVL